MQSGNDPDQSTIEQTLQLGRHDTKKRNKLLWTSLLVVVFFSGLLVWYMLYKGRASALIYETAPISRGTLSVSVTATGLIQPTNQVDISSQLSGTVAHVYADYNMEVKTGDVLADLDTSLLDAARLRAEAALAQAQAQLVTAQATQTESRRTYERQSQLLAKKFLDPQTLDTTTATLARADAQISLAKANIDLARADLLTQQINLNKTKLLSPINGMVLSRTVEPGQTVASSLQAPVLFQLAEDLTHMQLAANIDEADIGQVKIGQKANFTVEAYPGRNFRAQISTIYFAPQTVEGVVTYTAILTVDNDDLSLRPGMTATATIEVQSLSNALLVPNSVFRYKPVQPNDQKSGGFSLTRLLLPRTAARQQQPQALPAQSNNRTIWILKEDTAEKHLIETGLTDGKMTQLISTDLSEGSSVIITAAPSR